MMIRQDCHTVAFFLSSSTSQWRERLVLEECHLEPSEKKKELLYRLQLQKEHKSRSEL